MRRPGAVLLAVTCLTACGSGHQAPSPPVDREWIDNTAGVIDQLAGDLLLSASSGDTIAAARKALHDESSIYTLVVAYTDFGGCEHMVAAVGDAPARFARVDRTLHSACALLERAATLFTQATTTDDPRALLAATRTTRKAAPFLARARFELELIRQP
jgi:hypothetical protein